MVLQRSCALKEPRKWKSGHLKALKRNSCCACSEWNWETWEMVALQYQYISFILLMKGTILKGIRNCSLVHNVRSSFFFSLVQIKRCFGVFEYLLCFSADDKVHLCPQAVVEITVLTLLLVHLLSQVCLAVWESERSLVFCSLHPLFYPSRKGTPRTARKASNTDDTPPHSDSCHSTNWGYRFTQSKRMSLGHISTAQKLRCHLWIPHNFLFVQKRCGVLFVKKRFLKNNGDLRQNGLLCAKVMHCVLPSSHCFTTMKKYTQTHTALHCHTDTLSFFQFSFVYYWTLSPF